jgi:HNH endonuclease/Helix-turn-helix domain of resolvase
MNEHLVCKRYEHLLRYSENSKGCWISDRTPRGDGYAHIYNYAVHRLMWALYNGEIPEGMKILHKCDVRLCINPDHLFLGTSRDNTLDMYSKDRRPYALSEDEKEFIKTLHGMGKKQRDICRIVGVSKGSVYNVLNRS